MIAPLRVFAFDLVDGTQMFRVPFTDASATSTLNVAGSMSVDVGWTDEAAKLRVQLLELLQPWRAGLALVRDQRVIFQGPITATKWDPKDTKLSFTVGGTWDLLTKRMVLNHLLAQQWVDGEVLMDDKNPAPAWQQVLNGSYTDIAVQLITETLKWGPLAIDVPALEGGTRTRTYLGWDFATVADRIHDLTELEDAPELEFKPTWVNGKFRAMFNGAPELMETDWQWNTAAPGQRVAYNGFDNDGSPMTGQTFALGGRTDDLVLTAKADSSALTDAGWPLLQSSDTTHSTVSELPTLQGIAREAVGRGDRGQMSHEFQVGIEWPVHVGDWADITIDDVLLGRQTKPMKILEVVTDTSEFQTVRARDRS